MGEILVSEAASATVANGTLNGLPSTEGSYNSELKPDLRKPRDVLRDIMHFYDKQAKDIITDIILRLSEHSTKGTASELALMYKKFTECTDIAIRCAEKLAPYEHPKLESIEVKKELTHRFVLRAPTPIIDVNEWLSKAQEEQKLLALKPGHDLIIESKPKFDYSTAIEVISTLGDDSDTEFEDDEDEDL